MAVVERQLRQPTETAAPSLSLLLDTAGIRFISKDDPSQDFLNTTLRTIVTSAMERAYIQEGVPQEEARKITGEEQGMEERETKELLDMVRISMQSTLDVGDVQDVQVVAFGALHLSYDPAQLPEGVKLNKIVARTRLGSMASVFATEEKKAQSFADMDGSMQRALNLIGM